MQIKIMHEGPYLFSCPSDLEPINKLGDVWHHLRNLETGFESFQVRNLWADFKKPAEINKQSRLDSHIIWSGSLRTSPLLCTQTHIYEPLQPSLPLLIVVSHTQNRVQVFHCEKVNPEGPALPSVPRGRPLQPLLPF